MLKNFIKGCVLDKLSIKKMNTYAVYWFVIIFIMASFIFPACLTAVLKLLHFVQGDWYKLTFIFLSIFLRKVMITILLLVLLLLNKKLFKINNLASITIIKACLAIWFLNPVVSILLEVSGSSLINIPYSIYWFVFMKFYFYENINEEKDVIMKFLILTYLFFFVLLIVFMKYIIATPFFIISLII